MLRGMRNHRIFSGVLLVFGFCLATWLLRLRFRPSAVGARASSNHCRALAARPVVDLCDEFWPPRETRRLNLAVFCWSLLGAGLVSWCCGSVWLVPAHFVGRLGAALWGTGRLEIGCFLCFWGFNAFRGVFGAFGLYAVLGMVPVVARRKALHIAMLFGLAFPGYMGIIKDGYCLGHLGYMPTTSLSPDLVIVKAELKCSLGAA